MSEGKKGNSQEKASLCVMILTKQEVLIITSMYEFLQLISPNENTGGDSTRIH